MNYHLRIARPVSDIARTTSMYCAGLGLRVLGKFEDHQGFDGVMIGNRGATYHFEFTYCRNHPVPPTPTAEDLAVFYVSDVKAWQDACLRMEAPVLRASHLSIRIGIFAVELSKIMTAIT
jgi:catechol 2,3-dioxygenase-like lactoylglutathione lyase family enzyme